MNTGSLRNSQVYKLDCFRGQAFGLLYKDKLNEIMATLGDAFKNYQHFKEGKAK